jgi:hypothetical protein
MAVDFSGGLTILSTGSVGGKSMQDVIYEKVTQQYKNKIQKASDARKEVYDSRSKTLQADLEKQYLVAGGIKNAIDSIDKAVVQAKKIKDMIFDMKVYLESATKDPTYYAQEFNRKLTDINNAVTDAQGVYDLLGAKSRTNYEAKDYDLNVDGNRTTFLVQGYNMSDDYMVTDTDGKVWVPDMYSSIKRYNNYDSNDVNISTTFSVNQSASTGSGSATNYVITRTDTNYSSSSVDFTAGGVAYSGTVSKGGLGIGQSWLYGAFQDNAGIAQATSDVNSALDNADLMITQLSAMQGAIQGEYNIVENAVTDKKTEMNNVLIAQMHEEYDFAAKMKTEYEAAVTSLASIAQTQSQYSQIFGSLLGDNKLMNYMFSQTV